MASGLSRCRTCPSVVPHIQRSGLSPQTGSLTCPILTQRIWSRLDVHLRSPIAMACKALACLKCRLSSRQPRHRRKMAPSCHHGMIIPLPIPIPLICPEDCSYQRSRGDIRSNTDNSKGSKVFWTKEMNEKQEDLSGTVKKRTG
jgi:hypothetical protein